MTSEEKKVVIFGTGDIAELAAFYFETDSDYQVVGFTVDKEFLTDVEKNGLPIVAFEDLEDTFDSGSTFVFVALSYSKINKLRADKVSQVREKGFQLASYVSSRASILSVEPIGENAFILEDNTVQPFVKIGDNVTLWSGNHIGHHSTIGDHCFISSHVVVSGGVTIESYCFVGVNSTIRDHVTIGSSSVLGAGSLILGDAEPESVFIGKATEKSKVPSSRLRGI